MELSNTTQNSYDQLISQNYNGVMIIYKRGSGTFLMVTNMLIEHNENNYSCNYPLIDIHSINETHSDYSKLCKLFSTQNKSTLIVIKNGEVQDVLSGPISRVEVLKSIHSLES